MAPQKSTSVRLKARPTLVPFKDDTSLIAVRYEKTVQAEPPIPILTRLPRRSLSISTRRTCRSATSSLPSPPISPVVVTPPPAIEQHPAFRPRVPAADNDWKRDSGLAPTASSGATIVEECEDQDHAYDKIDALIVAGHVVQRQKLVTPSICDSESFYSTEDPSVAKRPLAGRCTRTAAQMSIAMDHYHLAQLQIAEPSDKSPNLSPVNIPDDFNLLSKDATDFSPISISIPTVSLLDDDFLTTLSFSNRGSIMFGGRRAFPAQTTDGTMEAKSQTDDVHAPAPASPPTPASEPAPPILHIKYEEPLQSAVASMREPFANEAASKEPIPNEVPSSEAPMMEPTESNGHSAPELNAAEVIDASAAETMTETTIEATTADPSAAQTTVDSTSQAAMKTPSIRVLSADVELESRKVRSLYASGDSINWEDGGRPSDVGEQLDASSENPTDETENDPVAELQPPAWGTPRSGSSYSQRPETRSEYEVAGGFEDWEDLNGYDVDRYGFINPRKPEARVGTPTDLKSSQHAPKKRNILKRDPFGLGLPLRGPNRKVSARSLNTQTSKASVASRRSTRSAIRHAGNLLPHNRDRRWMDEAGGMLSLSLGDEENIEKISEAIKRKEWERSEKWRKMAKVIKKGKDGEGMEFDFDVKNQKLIDRTWKGIPDRWRASAWFSFMASAARAHRDSPSEDSIITDFHRLQCRGSPDDVQIDLDVPRTISRHVMFRKRYTGGQRLLFRVLHALSLYFPNTGYVQGMASLAATLLCYFDEEKCFVMLVRMWQLRGLEKLYSPGFDGLMAALSDLQTKWLSGKDVAKKLTELCIDPTAYGTRWYLTLFNLSIPFAAQLRVWDVFLLLGENPDTSATKVPDSPVTMTGIDVLHATSAALIHALREVLLDSDFENAMKALTSWIPVKDEDLLMKVTRAEWKRQKKRP
ncbi:TBC domain-containing protein [Colletotrichum sp. SAR 10_70]|nr:TBC domain-containing protein [Colletotrichum sp. SAR 10_71]KAI8152873.1 TBC domain-containing protein [Colletotrichum sp. SAR 10_70]KAI8154217.1 TBC domain-containing protein [Colletotrichum sp. SAR 10_65]KAI8172933.1 TBC domain-containing protein [Colletotrichum sp. SAR 10_75]KAI8196447.1 TBC domain-containing protein [Colletotrichum sp. SAR 10_76]KAI8212862.1 TBC domain-containing protein [Colletotrichum sp. SAR 10_77]KAI8217205.1 TBC domain-containing protein [Colletotrichum sp. SAR 10